MDKLYIYDAIEKYAKNSEIRFHMPGHKGRVKHPLFELSRLDVTELDGTDIVQSVRFAEEDIAKIYGAKWCKILTDGATCGILSMVHAIKDLGKKVIINRSAHKSVYNALALNGLEPVIVDGGYVDGVLSMPTIDKLEEAIVTSDACAVLLTYPDYYGFAFDLKSVKALTKKYGKVLLVDNAHGSHLRFSDSIDYAGKYADAWVDGAHKTLSTFNQGAILFCSSVKLLEKIEESVEIFSTTSPSYLISASVEYGVKHMVDAWSKSARIAFSAWRKDFIILIKRLGLNVLDSDDEFKLAIDFKGRDTKKIEKILNSEGVYFELNDGRYILFMFSALTKREDFYKVYAIIKKAVEAVAKVEEAKEQPALSPIKVMPYLNAYNSEWEYVKLKNAEGRIAKENAGIFPPCYPIVVAGEQITADVIKVLSENASTFGVKDGKIKAVKE